MFLFQYAKIRLFFEKVDEFREKEKLLLVIFDALEICFYLCIGSFLARGLDPEFRQS